MHYNELFNQEAKKSSRSDLIFFFVSSISSENEGLFSVTLEFPQKKISPSAEFVHKGSSEGK